MDNGVLREQTSVRVKTLVFVAVIIGWVVFVKA